MITTKTWDVDMTTKYITASLVIVSRMLETFIPRFLDLSIRVCTSTRTKTATSTGTDGALNRRNSAAIRGNGNILAKGERQGHLDDWDSCLNARKTYVIQGQRNCGHEGCLKSFFQEPECMLDGVEVLAWGLCSVSERRD
jgi:hypothetical protein